MFIPPLCSLRAWRFLASFALKPTNCQPTTCFKAKLAKNRKARKKPSRKPQHVNDHVNDLDPDKRDDDSSETIDPKISSQHRGGAHRSILYAPKCKRDQGDDDKCIENNGRQNRRFGCLEPHDVPRGTRATLRTTERIESGKHSRYYGKVLCHVIGNRERGQRAASHQQLFANLNDLNQLGRV